MLNTVMITLEIRLWPVLILLERRLIFRLLMY